MTHEEMRDMYELYALGVLEPAERAEIDEHLATGCDTCRQSVKRAALTNSVLLSFAPEVAPPRSAKKKLMAGIGVPQKNWGWLAWAAVSAGLLVTTMWFSTEEHRRTTELALARDQVREINSKLSGVQQVVDFLNSPDTKQVNFGAGQIQPPKGNVFINPKNGVLLLATNLPQLPQGKIYQMWVIPKGGAPKPAGLFQSDSRGSAVYVQSGPVDLAATGAVAVTVEPSAGSAAPTTTPIIVAAVGP